MEASEAGRKRSVSREIPKAKAKAKTMAKDMDVDAGGSKRSGEESSPNKKGKKAKKEKAPAPLSVADVEVVKADAKPEQQSGARKEHGPEKDNSTSRSHWMSKDRGYLFNQASQHGIRLDKSLLTGKKEVFNVVKNKKEIVKVKKITKSELVELILKELS